MQELFIHMVREKINAWVAMTNVVWTLQVNQSMSMEWHVPSLVALGELFVWSVRKGPAFEEIKAVLA